MQFASSICRYDEFTGFYHKRIEFHGTLFTSISNPNRQYPSYCIHRFGCKCDWNFRLLSFQVLESWNIVLLHNFISSYIILQQQLFAFCYLGQIITSKLPEVGVAMYDVNWYNYSIKHRCHIEMIILRSQKVYILKGNRMLPCTLENFKEVRFIDARFTNLRSPGVFGSLHQFLFVFQMLNLTFSAYLLLLNFKNWNQWRIKIFNCLFDGAMHFAHSIRCWYILGYLYGKDSSTE